MEKKRKRPNFIDIILILLVIAVAFVAYYLSHKDAASEEIVKRTYVIEITELEPSMAQCVSVGDKVIDNIKNYDMGVVTVVEQVPALTTVLNEETGEYLQVEYPDKITLNITVEADTQESEKEITTVGGYTLRIGASISCTIGTLKGTGYIIGLDR